MRRKPNKDTGGKMGAGGNVKLYNKNRETVTMQEVIQWWLEHYEGLEHLTEGGRTSPETWYTINTILRRSFEKIKKTEGGKK